MDLKYKDQLSELPYNLNGFEERDRIAFRWTFEYIDDNSFIPVYIDKNLNPTKRRNDEIASNRYTCYGYALSFYNSFEAAKKVLLERVEHSPNFYKKVGTHAALGHLEKKDGVSNDAKSNGHFEHFEYHGVILNLKFNVIEQIIKL